MNVEVLVGRGSSWLSGRVLFDGWFVFLRVFWLGWEIVFVGWFRISFFVFYWFKGVIYDYLRFLLFWF